MPIFVMLRPRAGDFLYDADEFAVMLDDLVAFKSEGVAGLVFGCLTPNGGIDYEKTALLTA